MVGGSILRCRRNVCCRNCRFFVVVAIVDPLLLQLSILHCRNRQSFVVVAIVDPLLLSRLSISCCCCNHLSSIVVVVNHLLLL